MSSQHNKMNNRFLSLVTRPFRSELLTKIYHLLSRRERFQVVFLLFGMIIAALVEIGGLILIIQYIALLNDPAGLHENSLLQHIFISYFRLTDASSIIILFSGVLLFYFILKNGYLALMTYYKFQFTTKKHLSLSSRLFEKYIYAPWSFHLQRNTAELLRIVNSEVEHVVCNVLNPLLVLISESFVTTAIILMLMVKAPISTLAIILLFGGISYIAYYVYKHKIKTLGQKQHLYAVEMNKCVNQGLGSLKETKVMRREDFFTQVYHSNTKGFTDVRKFNMFMTQLPRFFLETLMIVSIVTISVILLCVKNQEFYLVMPKLALFAIAAYRIMPAVNKIVSGIANIRYHSFAVDVVYRELTLLDESFIEHQQHKRKSVLPILSFHDCIQMCDVHYRYPNTSNDSLSGINLTIPKGSSVALIGQSGAGKTTAVDIILGLIKPTSGKVLVDGQDIRKDLGMWQRKIGYIPQFIYLSDDTIRNNIAFGIADEKIDDAVVWESLRYAQLEEHVAGLSDKLDTLIGEHGVRLSGGQRQRVGIARALYHNPEILVMDEATSSLDTLTEEEITKSIERLSGEKTLIIIAHRLSTVEKCDVKYTFESGMLK